MPKPRRQNTLTAIWETLPDADPQAIEKAFLILFRADFQSQTVATIMPEVAELDKTN